MPSEPRDGMDASLARIMAAARPTSPALARRLRLRAVLASVLGVERPAPVLDGYVLDRQVGAGGMGVVYRGRALADDRPVAVKLLDPGAMVEHARFVREARMLRELRSPGVVGYLDHGTTADGHAYLVMEWVEGEDLAVRLRGGPLDAAAAVRLGLGIARALVPVHAAGVVHRDLKPSNVILVHGDPNDVRVIDFGIARATAPSSELAASRLTATGAVIGTPHYMAPEQLRGHADARTDVYGLGATLFEALAGRPPFVGEHPGAIMLAVLAEAPPSLAAIRPEIPGAVDALVGRMLAKLPADRPVDLTAVIVELAALAASLDRGRAPSMVLSRAERAPRTEAAAAPADPGGVIGRDRVIAHVGGVLAEAAAEQTAELVVLHGAAGIGKSALLDAVAARGAGWRCLRARARRDERGVPFATLRALLAGDPDPAADELRALLAPRDVRVDPVVLGDRVVLAWLDLVEAWTAAGPVLVLLDDAGLADLSSLRLIDAALAHLAGRAFVVAITHADGAPPPVGEGAVVTRIPVPPLGARAARDLARRWARDAGEDAIARAVQVAAGNPAHLRELCRAITATTSPGDERSVAELVWVRLSALEPEARRTLRAAAIVGRELWHGALAGLLGLPEDDAGLGRRIGALIADGHLAASPVSRIAAQRQLEFTSELGYLAAYELSNDADRRAGHLAMATWVAAHAPAEDALRARHLDGAGARDQASRHHLAAARVALAGGDTGVLEACLARARAADAPADVAGEATALHGQAQFWRGAIREALDASAEAMARLAPGAATWFDAASLAVTAAGQLGDHTRLWEIARAVVATAPDDGRAAERRVIAACRALSQLLDTREDTTALDAIVGQFPSAALGPEAQAWRHRATLARQRTPGFDPAIDAIVAAHEAHIADGDRRSAALMGIYLCSYYAWTGGWERARTVIDDALRVTRRLGVAYLTLWGAYAEAKLLVEIAPHAEARAALAAVVTGAAGSPRIRAGAEIYAALAASRADQPALAIDHARRARAAHAAAAILGPATAAEVRALLALGRIDEAATLGDALAPLATSPAWLPEFDELVRLAWAELALARDPADAGPAAARAAIASVEARAQTLADPLRRNEYRVRPHLVARTLAL